MDLLKRIWQKTNTRLGFTTLLVICFWLKTLVAYFVDFHIVLNDPLQFILFVLNPIATASFFTVSRCMLNQRGCFIYWLLSSTF